MGWLLKHNEKTNKWRIWTTISDGWITDWLTAEELKRERGHSIERDYRLQLIENYWTFPDGWSDKDTHKPYFNHEAKKAFLEWNLKLYDDPEHYDENIKKKMRELGISQN